MINFVMLVINICFLKWYSIYVMNPYFRLSKLFHPFKKLNTKAKIMGPPTCDRLYHFFGVEWLLLLDDDACTADGYMVINLYNVILKTSIRYDIRSICVETCIYG